MFLPQTVALHHSVECAFVQPGEARALTDATFGHIEDAFEIVALERVQNFDPRVRERLSQKRLPWRRGCALGRSRLGRVERPAFVAAQIGDTNLGPRCEQDGAFDDVDELADVPRPLVAQHGLHRIWAETHDMTSELAPTSFEKRMGEIGKILKSLGFKMERRERPAQSGSEANSDAKTGETQASLTEETSGSTDAETSVNTDRQIAATEDKGRQAAVAATDSVTSGDGPQTFEPDETDDKAEHYEETWRPRRRKRADNETRHAGKSSQRKPAKPARAKRRDEDRPQSTARSRPAKKSKQEKPIDPNSPFAALAKLKEDLEKGSANELSKRS